MNTKTERFLTFIMKEKTRNFFAFVFYVSFIAMHIEIDLPLSLKFTWFIFLMLIILYGYTVCLLDWMDKTFGKNTGKLGKKIIQEVTKIFKELVMFIPVLLVSYCITTFIMIGEPLNQIRVVESLCETPFFYSIYCIIIGPIIEELIYRFLPYRFIKNKTLYIIISTVVFAAMHVLHDTDPFYYICFYMIRPLYYGYRYHKTKDICVTISMHSLNNLISTLKIFLS